VIPEEARLQLSQLRPAGALDLKHNEPKYSCYSFLPISRYTQGVWLCSEKEVMDYVEMQKPYQHRIIDRDDFCVLEIREQKQRLFKQKCPHLPCRRNNPIEWR